MCTVRLVSDFTIDVFSRYVEHDRSFPACATQAAGFRQVYQTLLSPPTDATEDAAVVWTLATGVIDSFARAVRFEAVTTDEVLEDVDRFCEALRRYGDAVRFLFVPTWTAPLEGRGYGILDWQPDLGLAQLLARMNLRLAERLSEQPSAYVLDADRWLRAAGKRAFSSKQWFASKVPFGNQVFREATLDLKAALAAALGQSSKLIITDLDDTLWGGIVGEVGWRELVLGGHSAPGEAFVAYQGALKALSSRGIQLAIVSKNDEEVALEAIDRHPEMQLRRSDFAGWRINWQDKAQNIADLVDELNLGLDSVVFLDDTLMERERVRSELPAVHVPELPRDPRVYAEFVSSLRCFDTTAITLEDSQRTTMAATERMRRASRHQLGSVDEWVQSLEIRVHATTSNSADLPRTVQLLNKTNQINLQTRRLSEKDLLTWLNENHRTMWTFRVADRFGEYGLTGIISLEISGPRAQIVDFVLSCRVMGRRVEETLLHVAVSYAKKQGAKEVFADYAPTERNRPCFEFWQRSGFEAVEPQRFRWSTDKSFELPSAVCLELVP